MFGKIVYHVAHPHTKAVIVEQELATKRYVLVRFCRSVGFEGNKLAGKRPEWLCNIDLLFDTPEEAEAAHDPDWKDKL